MDRKRVLIIILLPFFLSGCWDSKEIENLGIVFGIALDQGKQEDVKGNLAPVNENDLVKVTYQFVNQHATGVNSGNLSGKPYINYSVTGDSFHEITREVALSRDRPVFSPHMKVIVISSTVLKDHNMVDIIDQYTHDDEIRPSCLVLVSKGEASEVLNLDEEGEIPSFRIAGISDNKYKLTQILKPVTLTNLQSKVNSGSSFLIQKVVSSNGTIAFDGAVAINGKTNTLKGELNSLDVQGITWIRGQGEGGLVKSRDEKTGEITVFDILSMSSTVRPKIANGDIAFEVDIHTEGRLSENQNQRNDFFDKEYLKDDEIKITKEIEDLVRKTTQKMQEELKVDLAGFGDQIRMKEPKTWSIVKEDWDEIFSTINIQYNISVNIKAY